MSKVQSKDGVCSIRCIHVSPSDTGHGCVRRLRGWKPGSVILSHFWCCTIIYSILYTWIIPAEIYLLFYNCWLIFFEPENSTLTWNNVLAQHPRTLALRKDAGRWIADPQAIYDFLSEMLQEDGKQVSIPELFWLTDEKLFLAGTAWDANSIDANIAPFAWKT